MEYVDRFLDFVSDNRRHVTTRVAAVVISLLLLVLIDNIFSFSYNYTIERRISNAKNITELLKDQTLSSDTRGKLLVLREQVLGHQTARDYLESFWKNMSSTSHSKQITKAPIAAKPIRSDFWQLVSSSGIWILFTLIGTPLILFVGDLRILQRITSALGFLLMMSLIIYLHYTTLGLLPDMIFGSWTWNYVANAIIHISVIAIILQASNNASKTKYA